MEGQLAVTTDPKEIVGIPSYDHIPSLWDLMPNSGGQPGITYAQVCTHNAGKAQTEGWGQILGRDGRPAKFYAIEGPKGKAEMVLLGQGKAIPGGEPPSGARECLVDNEVVRLTGFEPDSKNPIEVKVVEKKKPGISPVAVES